MVKREGELNVKVEINSSDDSDNLEITTETSFDNDGDMSDEEHVLMYLNNLTGSTVQNLLEIMLNSIIENISEDITNVDEAKELLLTTLHVLKSNSDTVTRFLSGLYEDIVDIEKQKTKVRIGELH